jgi:factor associated with neutral sphingomyelinase activation
VIDLLSYILSITDSWDSVLNNPANVKELIPHFFALPADFLVNKEELNLGVRQNGKPVGDVVLPAWADSPEDRLRSEGQSSFLKEEVAHSDML